MIISVILIVLMCRVLADLLMATLMYTFQINHYRLPKKDWKYNLVCVLLAMTLWMPIVARLP